MKPDLTIIGHWAFTIGIILAVIAGFAIIPALSIVLLILGLIVGFLNIKEKESNSFLVAVVALLVIGVAGLQLEELLTPVVVSILNNFIAFIAAAGLVVAIKQVLAVAKPISETP